MLFNRPTLALIPFATALLTSLIALRLLRRSHSPTAPAATLLFASLSAWLFAASLSLVMANVPDQILVGKLIYPGVLATPVAVLLLAARASRHDRWITPWTLCALWAPPVATLLLVMSNDLHGWIWPSIQLEELSDGPRLVWAHGPAFWAQVSYAYVLLGAATVLLASKYLRDWHLYRVEAILVFAGLAAPWMANAIYLSGHSPIRNFDLTPYGFALTAILIAWGLRREGILEALPVSRSTVVQELEDGLLVLDWRGRVVDLNAAAREILGMSEAAVQDLQVDDALARCPQLRPLLEGPAATASSAIEIETGFGVRTFDVRVSELREAGRESAGRLVVLRDVTDYLRASEAARAATVAKSQFLANMSHEIRTPMNGVLGLTQHLSHLELDSEQRSVVSDILRSANGLLQIIDDILDFSKLEAGKLRIDPIPFQPHVLVSDVTTLLEGRARDAGIVLETSISADVPPWLLGDVGRIRQVLLNLTSNALKFTKEGGVTVDIRCDAFSPEGVRVRFEVVDTGIGIPSQALETIFDAFTQADASTTRRFGGTGLGLAISRELVGCMGGELGVASEMGQGSRFWVVLPLGVCGAPDVIEAPAKAIPARTGRARRVLAAEDNAVNQRVLVGLLERLGCSVELASNGLEAVERARGGAFDLVLMDCQMPVLDGFDATREIRALGGEASRMPIVAVTAHALPGDRERCLAQGMDDYVTKPLRMDELERVLARWAP